MEEEIELSVIIVGYHSDEFIFDAIRSVLTCSDLERHQFEIIIVDNSPAAYSEHSFEQLRQEFGPETLILIHNSHNGGYGQGNNLGIEAAKGTYICIMNPDVNLIKPVFRRVLDRFKRDENLALLGGKQYGHKNVSFYFNPEYEFPLFTTPLTHVLNSFNCYLSPFMYLSGALLFIDKAKFKDIGNFDENIFLYGEEPDITRRFMKLNLRSAFDKEIPYRHLIEGRTAMNEGSFDVMLKSTAYYFEKFNFNFKGFLKRKVFSYYVVQKINQLFMRRAAEQNARYQMNQYRRYLK